MKEKIKSIFSKPQKTKQPIFKNDKEELEYLREENKTLKQGFIPKAIEKFKTRRSIRNFSSKPIDFEIIYKIIEAGLNAPCAGNIQSYKIIVLENKDKMKQIAQAALQQYWMTSAPYFLIVIREEEEPINIYPEYGHVYAIQNAAAVAENIIMAAHFYDLGACWVECGDNNNIKEIIEVPKEKYVDAIIPIGYPQESPTVEKVDARGLVFFNKWGEKKK